MVNNNLQKVIMIFMAALLLLAITPVAVAAGEITKAAVKKPSTADKKLQENITKAEKQIKALKTEVLESLETTDIILEEEFLPLVFEIGFTLADAEMELEEDVSADLEKRTDSIDAIYTSITNNLDSIDANYKKAQGLKKKNPSGYLKELQKIVGKYNTIKQQLNNLDKQIDEYITILEDILVELNPDGELGDIFDDIISDDDLTDDLLTDDPNQPAT